MSWFGVFSVFRLVKRDMKMMLNRSNVGLQLVSPLMYIFVVGFIYSSIIEEVEINGGKEISYTAFLASGIIVMQIMFSSMSAGVMFWADRRYGMFEQILTCPFERSEYILSKILSAMFQGIISGLVVLIISFPILEGEGLEISILGTLYIVFGFVFGAFFFGALTLTISVLVKSNETFNMLIGVMFMPFIAFSTIFYPVSQAPSLLKTISYVNPLTYATDILRTGLFGLETEKLLYKMFLLFAESLLMFYIAVIGYKKHVEI